MNYEVGQFIAKSGYSQFVGIVSKHKTYEEAAGTCEIMNRKLGYLIYRKEWFGWFECPANHSYFMFGEAGILLDIG